MHYILESTFVRIVLFLKVTPHQETHIYINLRTLFLLFMSLFDNNFILIGYSKQCMQRQRTRGVLHAKVDSERLRGRSKLLLVGSLQALI